jgi:hypothetical protein
MSDPAQTARELIQLAKQREAEIQNLIAAMNAATAALGQTVACDPMKVAKVFYDVIGALNAIQSTLGLLRGHLAEHGQRKSVDLTLATIAGGVAAVWNSGSPQQIADRARDIYEAL